MPPRRAAVWAAVLVMTLSLLSPFSPLRAEDESVEAAKQLLQKGLTLHEINREVDRLNAQKAGIDRQIADLNQTIDRQKAVVQLKKAHAANVLRAYYTGERASLWLTLLSVRDMSEAIAALEYLDQIFENDRYAISTYRDSFRKLADTQRNLSDTRRQLDDVIALYRKESDRLTSLQNEVEQALAMRSDKDAIEQQMEALAADWQQRGLPAFRQYLLAVSDAMGQLDAFLRDYPDSLEQKSFTSYTLRLADSQLNAFLRKQNPLFRDFSITFGDGEVDIAGRKDGMDLNIKGRYTVVDTPQNAIVFVIDRMTFNGFDLPDTTVRDLSKDSPLSFRPQDMISFLQATGVATKKGELTINLKLNLRS